MMFSGERWAAVPLPPKRSEIPKTNALKETIGETGGKLSESRKPNDSQASTVKRPSQLRTKINFLYKMWSKDQPPNERRTADTESLDPVRSYRKPPILTPHLTINIQNDENKSKTPLKRDNSTTSQLPKLQHNSDSQDPLKIIKIDLNRRSLRKNFSLINTHPAHNPDDLLQHKLARESSKRRSFIIKRINTVDLVFQPEPSSTVQPTDPTAQQLARFPTALRKSNVNLASLKYLQRRSELPGLTRDQRVLFQP